MRGRRSCFTESKYLDSEDTTSTHIHSIILFFCETPISLGLVLLEENQIPQTLLSLYFLGELVCLIWWGALRINEINEAKVSSSVASILVAVHLLMDGTGGCIYFQELSMDPVEIQLSDL